MNKKIWFIIIAAVLAIFFAIFIGVTCFSGCSGSGNANKKIVLAWDFGVTKPVFRAIADEYQRLNEDVEVILDQKDGQSYTSWLSGQLTKASPDADIVITNVVQNYYSPQYFVDFSKYVIQKNPYANNQIWKNVLDKAAYAETRGTQKGQIFTLNNEQVITGWFYNKDMFDEMGVAEHVGSEPENWNWDDLIKACDFISLNGKVPLAISGVYQSFWAWQFGWLFRTYADQYFRDMEMEITAQPGDYCYDEELQSQFVFDPADPYNDNDEGYIYNILRLAKMVKDGDVGPSHGKFQEMVSNLKRLVPEYVPNGYTSMDMSEAGKMFIRGEAAIYIDLIKFYAGIERTFQDVGSEPFNVGIFKYPPMTGENAAVDYTRDMGGANGYYGIIYKNQKQADLCVDFLKFFMSPKGQSLYLSEMEKENIAPGGVSLIKDVEMPDKWKGKYDVEFNGNADSNPYTNFARGFFDEQESVRGFVEYSQAFFKSGSTVSILQYCNNLQQNCVDAIPYWLRNMGYKQTALDNPAFNPMK